MDITIPQHRFANYLPDELLLHVLECIPPSQENQKTLASFVAVCRQWYDVGIPILYETPYLIGNAYTLFVRTLCPSVIPRIKRSELAGLVKALDLSHIVHQGAKSTTARLLARTKSSLEVFVAPQASFAINCWASLSKCSRLKVLDLGLISEAISYQSLNQTLRQLLELEQLYMPRCNTEFGSDVVERRLHWPPRLQHLSMSGTIHARLLNEMLQQPATFPPTLCSMSILHCPRLLHSDIRSLLKNIAGSLTRVELRHLPEIKQGRFNSILDWLPHLTHLTIAIEYIDQNFAHLPEDFAGSTHWHLAKPLTYLALVSSGQNDIDPHRAFTIVDMWDLMDTRYFGRLRRLYLAASTGWQFRDEGAEWEALRDLLLQELDKENWIERRWHYEGLRGVPEGMTYEEWIEETPLGRKMRPRAAILKDM